MLGLRELKLHAIDSVDAVDKEDENEDERDLHAILQFGYEWILGDESEQLSAPGKR